MSWKIDPAHSENSFSIRHLMIANVRGRFEAFDGMVEFSEDNPLDASVEIEIDAASINTRESKRDAHLRSADFFDAEKFPYLRFKSKRIVLVGDSHGHVTGDLTIRDVTREVTLDVQYNGKMKSPYDFYSAGFSATTTINRKDWGLTWNVALETGGFLVGDEVKINLELEIIEEQVREMVA
jgi:polyisoprenoid-binding protein YceI